MRGLYRLARGIVASLLTIFFLLFALSNRELVELSVWPLPFNVPMPLFFPILTSLGIGFLMGQLMRWNHGPSLDKDKSETVGKKRKLSDIHPSMYLRHDLGLDRKLAPARDKSLSLEKAEALVPIVIVCVGIVVVATYGLMT